MGDLLKLNKLCEPHGLYKTWDFVAARDVFPIVRKSRMWCPHDIGRDSWVWGEQGTLCTLNSPHEVGEEALSKRSPLSGDSVPPSWVKMVVVVVVFVVVVAIALGLHQTNVFYA